MDLSSPHSAPQTPPSVVQIGRRRLILRDGLKFLTLTLVAVVAGAITTLLFRSFEARREDLSVRWAIQGRDAMRQGHPQDAVAALRISLSYHPGDRDNELALAEALAASGHTNEAENYFLNLWQASPGDGLINLQLARLERSRGDAQKSADYYRAAVFGTWAGDAPKRRRDTRIELSKYLMERGQLQAARAELTIAAGNNPDAPTQLAVGQMLEEAGDPRDAMIAYRSAEQDDAEREVAQARAGELCYRMGDYVCAEDFLMKALRNTHWTADQVLRMTTLRDNAQRLQELSFTPGNAPFVRASHLLGDAHIAQERLKSCITPAKDDDAGQTSPPAIVQLQARWKELDSATHRAALRHDEDLQDRYGDLIFETETTAATTCGPATGDDALLLYLHDHPTTHFGAQ